MSHEQLIEEVAKAICNADKIPNATWDDYPEETYKDMRDDLRKMAKAAIKICQAEMLVEHPKS